MRSHYGFEFDNTLPGEASWPYRVVDLYAKVLPKTNCGDCGYPTCLAFDGMVVSQKLPLGKHLPRRLIDQAP